MQKTVTITASNQRQQPLTCPKISPPVEMTWKYKQENETTAFTVILLARVILHFNDSVIKPKDKVKEFADQPVPRRRESPSQRGLCTEMLSSLQGKSTDLEA